MNTEQEIKAEAQNVGARLEVVKCWKHTPTAARLRAASEGGNARLIKDSAGDWLLLSLVRRSDKRC